MEDALAVAAAMQLAAAVEEEPAAQSSGEIDQEARSAQHGWRRWSAKEHAQLEAAVASMGTRSWAAVASYIPGRTGKQCRERWLNHVSSDAKKGPWSDEDEHTLMKMHSEMGTQWSRIARHLGRGDNAVKNHFNATIRSKSLNKSPTMLWYYTRELKAGRSQGDAYKAALLKWEPTVGSAQVVQALGFIPSEVFAGFKPAPPALRQGAPRAPAVGPPRAPTVSTVAGAVAGAIGGLGQIDGQGGKPAEQYEGDGEMLGAADALRAMEAGEHIQHRTSEDSIQSFAHGNQIKLPAATGPQTPLNPTLVAQLAAALAPAPGGLTRHAHSPAGSASTHAPASAAGQPEVVPGMGSGRDVTYVSVPPPGTVTWPSSLKPAPTAASFPVTARPSWPYPEAAGKLAPAAPAPLPQQQQRVVFEVLGGGAGGSMMLQPAPHAAPVAPHSGQRRDSQEVLMYVDASGRVVGPARPLMPPPARQMPPAGSAAPLGATLIAPAPAPAPSGPQYMYINGQLMQVMPAPRPPPQPVIMFQQAPGGEMQMVQVVQMAGHDPASAPPNFGGQVIHMPAANPVHPPSNQVVMAGNYTWHEHHAMQQQQQQAQAQPTYVMLPPAAPGAQQQPQVASGGADWAGATWQYSAPVAQ